MIGNLLSRLRRAKHNYYIKGLVKKGLKIGKNSQIVDECFLDAAHCYLIDIQDNCTIAPKVSFIAHDASTYKFLGYSRIGNITVESNCFIGFGATILPGVTIGTNSIVAAGSVVTKSVPADSIVAGNPAKVISKTSEYLTRIKAEFDSEESVFFGEEYHDDQISPERLALMQLKVKEGKAFIK